MALKVELFPIDRSTREPAALNERLRNVRADGVKSISIVEMPGGGFAFSVAYEETPVRLVSSSPPNGAVTYRTIPIHLVFDEDLEQDVNKLLTHISAYRGGTLVALAAGDLSVIRNRLTIGTALINSTAPAYYQLVLAATLPAASGRMLGRDEVLTFKVE